LSVAVADRENLGSEDVDWFFVLLFLSHWIASSQTRLRSSSQTAPGQRMVKHER
jgi:hypothetical protein